MATTITVPTPSIHWLLYPLCVAAMLGALWLWHDTKIKDAAALQAVKTATSSQAQTDQKVKVADKTAAVDLKKKNTTLAKKLADAKTTQQQIDLINTTEGVHLETQATIPSSVALPVSDLPVIAQAVTERQEALNQIDADMLELAGKDLQISARDQTIDAQSKEITTLQGGSHLKRFLKATEHIAIGVGVGVAIGYAIHK